MNKRGGFLTDGIVYIALAFGFAIILGVLYFAVTHIFGAFEEITPELDENFSENITKAYDDTLGQAEEDMSLLKYVAVMILIAMFLSLLLHGMLVRVNPIFFVTYILVSIVVIVVSVPVANAYEEIYTNPILTEAFAEFAGMNFIIYHLPIWTTLLFIFGSIILIVSWKTRPISHDPI